MHFRQGEFSLESQGVVGPVWIKAVNSGMQRQRLDAILTNLEATLGERLMNNPSITKFLDYSATRISLTLFCGTVFLVAKSDQRKTLK